MRFNEALKTVDENIELDISKYLGMVQIMKFNPYHDQRGRFSSAGGAHSVHTRAGERFGTALAMQHHGHKISPEDVQSQVAHMKANKGSLSGWEAPSHVSYKEKAREEAAAKAKAAKQLAELKAKQKADFKQFADTYDPKTPPSAQDLSKMKLGQLRAIAAKEGIKGAGSKTKKDLMGILESHYQDKLGTTKHTPKGKVGRHPDAENRKDIGKIEGYHVDLSELNCVKYADGNFPPLKNPLPYDNKLLKSIYEHQGYDGQPHLVTREEMNDYIKGGDREVFRAVCPSGGSSIKDMHDQYMTGPYFAGSGIHGHGTYAAGAANRATTASATKAALKEALAYGSGKDSAMRIAIRKDAKIITENEARSLSQRELQSIQRQGMKKGETKSQYLARLSVCQDPGYWAAARGYDAIYCQNGNRPGVSSSPDYWVILNRTATRVQDAPAV